MNLRNTVENDNSRADRGFSLIEVLISMFMLALLSLFLIATLTNTKYMAEDNFYEATALSASLSLMEQMMGVAEMEFSASPFTMVSKDNLPTELTWGSPNTLEVPVISEEDGSGNVVVNKFMDLTITPRRTPASDTDGWWIDIEYSYVHPGNGKTRTHVIRNMRGPVR